MSRVFVLPLALLLSAIVLTTSAGILLLEPGPQPVSGEVGRALAETQPPRIMLAEGGRKSLWLDNARLMALTKAALAGQPTVVASAESFPGRGHIHLSYLALPALARPYLNIEIGVSEAIANGDIDYLRVGRVRFPTLVSRWLWRLALLRLDLAAQWQTLGAMIERIEFRHDGVTVELNTVPDLERLTLEQRIGLGEGKATLAEALEPYFAAVRRLPRGSSVREALNDVIRVAEHRSRGGNHPVDENRKALIALGIWAAGDQARQLGLDLPIKDARLPAFSLTFDGREDLARHFLISAGLAVVFGADSAESIGLLREIEDSRTGSGFSFRDLAANLAGIRYAEVATRSRSDAMRHQQSSLDDATPDRLLPTLDGLGEFLAEQEFLARYGGLDDPRFKSVVADIRERIKFVEARE